MRDEVMLMCRCAGLEASEPGDLHGSEAQLVAGLWKEVLAEEYFRRSRSEASQEVFTRLCSFFICISYNIYICTII